MTHLLVIRHGQSEWNALGRVHGWSDPPLSRLGEHQATAAARALARQVLDGEVVTSDLRRARRTAEIIAGALRLSSVMSHRELRAHHLGDWDGQTWQQIERDVPDARIRWTTDAIDQAPNGEHRLEFHARVRGAVQLVVRRRSAGRLLVVTHAGVIRALRQLAALGDDGTASLGHEAPWTGFLSGHWFEWCGGRLRERSAFLFEPPLPSTDGAPHPGGQRT